MTTRMDQSAHPPGDICSPSEDLGFSKGALGHQPQKGPDMNLLLGIVYYLILIPKK